MGAIESVHQEIGFEADRISLAIPEEVILKDGWNIMPLMHPTASSLSSQ